MKSLKDKNSETRREDSNNYPIPGTLWSHCSSSLSWDNWTEGRPTSLKSTAGAYSKRSNTNTQFLVNGTGKEIPENSKAREEILTFFLSFFFFFAPRVAPVPMLQWVATEKRQKCLQWHGHLGIKKSHFMGLEEWGTETPFVLSVCVKSFFFSFLLLLWLGHIHSASQLGGIVCEDLCIKGLPLTSVRRNQRSWALAGFLPPLGQSLLSGLPDMLCSVRILHWGLWDLFLGLCVLQALLCLFLWGSFLDFRYFPLKHSLICTGL